MTSPNTDACRTRARTALLARDVGHVLLVDVPELCAALDAARDRIAQLEREGRPTAATPPAWYSGHA